MAPQEPALRAAITVASARVGSRAAWPIKNRRLVRDLEQRTDITETPVTPPRPLPSQTRSQTDSPWLEGQSKTYPKAQLRAFASGERHNDISEQMRNIARAMTPQEIEDAAASYASQPPEIVKTID